LIIIEGLLINHYWLKILHCVQKDNLVTWRFIYVAEANNIINLFISSLKRTAIFYFLLLIKW